MNMKAEIAKIQKKIEDLSGVNLFRIFTYRGREAYKSDNPRLSVFKNVHVIVIVPAQKKR